MDPGRVVWLPGSGFDQYDEDIICENNYPGTYACGDASQDGGTLIYCCPF